MATKITVSSARYQDHDDCLTAAAADYANDHDLEDWEVTAAWADEESNRREIVLTVPTESVAAVVVDIDTGDRLDGAASSGLIESSVLAEPTGAVAAYCDDEGTWQYVREDEQERMRRLGREVRTVYVEVSS